MAANTPTTVTQVITATMASATPSSTLRAPHQGGILEGANPSEYDPKNPITIFIIQAAIIIIFCRLLHYPLSKLRQPRVIAEVIGGIILGPSIMGRIPGFTNAIFPAASMPTLTLVANIGLVLFLFLVGLEVDLRFLVSNWRIALSVGALGMILPFGLGAAIAYGLYNQFRNEPGTTPIGLGVYTLFIGVAMAITAFPVLCRILTELKLLGTPVGVIVLSAGVGNDVVGWILLALCVALVNAGSGLTALWVLLVCLGYTLFLVYAIRPGFLWILRRSGSLQNGPTQGVVALTLLMVLASAFFTGIIGVHPIFGGFMIGLICPHEGGFAIKVTEKVEDLVSVLFLPLYFALSGLSTNLGLLDNGITWGYVIGVISVAFFAKIMGGTLAARFNGLVWRESFTIGVLMSCKGLVELIVLNIGLQAKILTSRTFTIFVVMALVTTFATTPLTSALYPRWYQIKLEAWKRGEIDWDGNRLIADESSTDGDAVSTNKAEASEVKRILTYLRLDGMPGILAFVSLLGKPREPTITSKVHPSKRSTEEDDPTETYPRRSLQVHGVRLTELTDRESSVMKVSELDQYSYRDPVVNTFRTFGQVRHLPVSGTVIVVPESSYAATLVDRASDLAADLILIPWSESGNMSEYEIHGPGNDNRFANGSFSEFVTTTLRHATCTTAMFIDNGFGSKRRRNQPRPLTRTVSSMSARDMRGIPNVPINKGHHIFLPYFGSEDDKAALRFVLQLAQDPVVTATIVHYELPDSMAGDVEKVVSTEPRIPGTKAPATTVVVPFSSSHYTAFFSSLRDSLPNALASRVVFHSVSTSTPLRDMLATARTEIGQDAKGAGDLVVLGQNSEMSSVLGRDQMEGAPVLESEARRALGVVAEGVVRAGLGASLLVLRAGPGEQGVI